MAVATYAHRALFHETNDELVDCLVPFVTGGIEANEGVVVIVAASVGEILRQRIGSNVGYDVWDSTDVYTFPSAPWTPQAIPLVPPNKWQPRACSRQLLQSSTVAVSISHVRV